MNLKRQTAIRAWLLLLSLGLCAAGGGCGDLLSPPAPEFPFSLPLHVDGRPVGKAIIDTGGGYEVLLKEPYGLTIIYETRVVAFAGSELVSVTEPFTYAVGGFETFAPGALVGVSTCDCNGLGYHFFRRTGMILALDFSTQTADFVLSPPDDGVLILFSEPPAHLPDFLSSFIKVEVAAGGSSRIVTALLDTGANVSVMRRGLVGAAPVLANVQTITVAHAQLGGVRATVGLFDTPGLPDLIIGTDVMGVWADQWFLDFSATGGYATLFFDGDRPDLTPETANLALR